MSAPQRSADTGRKDPPTKPQLHWAWWSLLLYPVAIFVSVRTPTAVLGWLGSAETPATQLPWWQVALAFAAAIIVLLSPFVVTTLFSNRATAGGEAHPRLPLIIAVVLVGLFVAGFMVPLFLGFFLA